MRVDKGSKRIMNLDITSVFRESWCINCGGWWEWGASKMPKNLVFPIALVTTRKAKFKKSYLTQFYSELSHSCIQIKALYVYFWKNKSHSQIQNIMWDINEMVRRCHLSKNSFSIININRSQISFQLTLIGSNHFYFRLNQFQIYLN